jgi:FkbM family methyltransferase
MSLFPLRRKFQSGEIERNEYIREMHKVHSILFEYADFIHDTDIARIEIGADEVQVTTKSTGIKMLCDRVDEWIPPFGILNFGFYEKNYSEMICRLIDNGDTIFDIGANIGWYSLTFSKLFPGSQIFSFEPIPNSFNALKRNIEINQSTNIHPFNCGLSDRSGELDFYYYPDISGASSAVNLLDRSNFQRVISPIKTLDEVISENRTGVDFIKCDVEGSELLVFKGGIESIQKYKPIIFAEMLRKWSAKFKYHPNEIIRLLADAGYQCFRLVEGRLEPFFEMNENTVDNNFFFLHTDKHASKIRLHTA